jgi:hypothetical protein
MSDKLTNLLSPDRRRLITRDYVLRVCVVIAVLITILMLAASALLIPAYVFLNGSVNTKKTSLAHIETTLSSAEGEELSTRLATLAANAETLTTLSDSASLSTTIRDILSVSRPGVTLSGLSLTRSKDKSPGTAIVTGLSATRDALRNYQLALQGSQFALSASLPVSAYAKDSNIAFTITITLAP